MPQPPALQHLQALRSSIAAGQAARAAAAAEAEAIAAEREQAALKAAAEAALMPGASR